MALAEVVGESSSGPVGLPLRPGVEGGLYDLLDQLGRNGGRRPSGGILPDAVDAEQGEARPPLPYCDGVGLELFDDLLVGPPLGGTQNDL